MSLPASFLDELRARIRVSEVVGNDVRLQKAGKEYKACCPFHDEKTPSFYINDQKGFYHCFGCSAHGDAISYLVDGRGMGFMDAVKELASKAGMEVPAPDPQAQKRAEQRAELVDVTEAAASWYEEQLGGIEGAGARAYLEKRGLTPDLIKRFRLGFAPDDRGRLKRALDRFGLPKLVDSGMVIAPDEPGREPYDRFRGRLMIPIRDARGRVIAFGGRILGDGQPKYLNSPETPLFDKGRQLYNLDRAQTAARKAERLIVVEGYMDAIALSKAGIDEVVAPLGTALTEDQLRLMWRVSEEPILCFDGDEAGRRAAERALRRALPMLAPSQSLRFVLLPAGMDPDDMIASGGPALFEKALASSLRYDEFLWKTASENIDGASPVEREKLKQLLQKSAFEIEDAGLAAETWKSLKDRFFAQYGFRKGQVQEMASIIRSLPQGGEMPLPLAYRTAVLFGLTRYPDVAVEHTELVAALDIEDKNLNRWRHIILDAAVETPDIDESGLEALLREDAFFEWRDRNLKRDLGYSFYYRANDWSKAKDDLLNVIRVLVAEKHFDDVAQAREDALKAQMSEKAWEDVQRYREDEAARQAELNRFVENVAA
ncbi:DNA primase [Sphingomicrobium arenosum]|uniref:DNA primase n=1 Tax=Sphingomicrobium arenosum TaxID=2233861 RepID=UPI00223EDB2E|nr:DNA primase [Sphingomicrobium arenosum]